VRGPEHCQEYPTYRKRRGAASVRTEYKELAGVWEATNVRAGSEETVELRSKGGVPTGTQARREVREGIREGGGYITSASRGKK